VSLYRLAERLHMTVGRLGVEMDSEELTTWHAYDMRERRLREADEQLVEAATDEE
jgi:hypothetical protein